MSLCPRILKSSLALLALMGTQGFAQPADEELRKLENAEAGLSLSGKATSRFLQAGLGGDSARAHQTSHENSAFTQAEIELKARPGAHSRGTLLFRVHQDWASYYDEGPTPISARWFDYSGELFQDRVRFAVGDFRGRLSPLTLQAVEPDILNEPDIFRDKRESAMAEFFLGDSRVPLQGLNVAYDHGWIPGTLGVEAEAAFARLRNVHSGSASWLHWTDEVEKGLAASSWKVGLFDFAKLGFAQSYALDDVTASRAKNNSLAAARRGLLTKTVYEDNRVNAFSLGLDAARWLSAGKLALALEAEYALSEYHSRMDDSTPARGVKLVDLEKLDGTALRADLRAGFGREQDPFRIGLKAGYLKNDKGFVSDMAQTPVFIGRRILNSRNRVGGPGGGYHTLDALYNHIYAVDPITSLNTSELWYGDTKRYNGTNNWYRAPFMKNSYSFYTTTKSERDSLVAGGVLDQDLQLLFPFGPATPNRSGLAADLSVAFLSGALEARILFASLAEVEGPSVDSLTALPADFARMGGGLDFALQKLLGWKQPLELSGSYVMDSRKRAAYSSKGVAVPEESFETAFLNAGLHAGIWKGLSILGGYQQIKSNPFIARSATPTTRSFTEGEVTENQWAVGLEYKLNHGAYVTAEYGRLGFDEAITKTAYTQDIVSATLVIGY